MGWFVEYYVFDPVDEGMIRKRIRIQKLIKRYRTKREQAIAAQQIAEELNHKLAGGWSPLHESDDSRLYTPIDTLRDRFLEAKKREGCRDTTMVNYTSMTGLFLHWCEDSGRERQQELQQYAEGDAMFLPMGFGPLLLQGESFRRDAGSAQGEEKEGADR